MCGNPLNRNAISYEAVSASAGTLLLQLQNRPIRHFALTEQTNVTLALENGVDGGIYRLMLLHDTPNYTITLPSGAFLTPNSSGTISVTWAGVDRRSLTFTYVNGAYVFWWEQVVSSGDSVPSSVLKTSADIDATLRQVSDQTGNFSQLLLANNGSAFNGALSVGQSSAPTARLDLRGQGATSGTTALLVRNSSGSQAFKITDDGCGFFGTSGQAKFTAAGQLVMDRWRSKTSFEDDWLDWASDELNLVIANTQKASFRNGGTIFGGTSLAGSAVFQIDSTTKGFIAPRMTTAQKNAIVTPVDGLTVYDTTLGAYCFYRAIETSWKTISYT